MSKAVILIFVILYSTAHAIVGGRIAESSEMPSVIYLSFDDCSAVVIGKKSYLTAAHCVLDWETLKMRETMHPGSKQRIFPFFLGGKSNTPQATVREVQIHPSYLKSLSITKSIDKTSLEDFLAFDLAIVSIEEEFPVTPADLFSGKMPVNARTAIVGYGCEDPRMTTGGSKKKIALKDILNFNQNVFSSPAIGSIGISYACPGDSGGAVFFQPARTNHWLLAGINRFGGNPLITSSNPNDMEALKSVISGATHLDISFIQQWTSVKNQSRLSNGFQGSRL